MLNAFIQDMSEITDNEQELLKKLETKYVEAEGGGFMLEVKAQSGFALEKLSGLKSTLNKLKIQVQDLKENQLPEGKTMDDIEAMRTKLKTRLDSEGSFNADEERKAIKLDIQQTLDDDYKSIIKTKDDRIGELETGMMGSARDGIYNKAAALGIPKVVLQGYIEQQTKVSIDGTGTSMQYINLADGTAREFIDDNGDRRPFNDSDMLKELTKHETFGKLIPTDARSGTGGQSDYSTSTSGKVKIVSDREAGNDLEGMMSGEVQRD